MDASGWALGQATPTAQRYDSHCRYSVRASAPALENSLADARFEAVAPLLVEQLVAMGFDSLTLRQGTLHVTTADGISETISDIQAELTGKRRGQVGARVPGAALGDRSGRGFAFAMELRPRRAGSSGPSSR